MSFCIPNKTSVWPLTCWATCLSGLALRTVPFVCMHVKQPLFPRRNTLADICGPKYFTEALDKVCFTSNGVDMQRKLKSSPCQGWQLNRSPVPHSFINRFFLTFSFYALAFYSTHAHIFCLQSTLEIVDTAILFCSSLSCAWWWFIFQCLQVYLKPVSPDFMFFCLIFFPFN